MAAERTAVLGMGNPVVSDDRAGLAVAEELRRLLAEAPIEGGDTSTISEEMTPAVAAAVAGVIWFESTAFNSAWVA